MNVDYYIVQKDELEIDTSMANRLVDFLVIGLNIPKIDAQMHIKHFPGIMKISGKEKAMNLSQAFQAAGLDNFILEAKDFVPLPERETISSLSENTIETPGLIAAGMISHESVETVTQWNALDVRMLFAAPLIVNSGIRQNTKRTEHPTYYIDLITREKRWEISRTVFPEKEIKKLEQFDLLKTYLTIDMRKMFNGRKDIKVFTERKYYNEYLTRLMQVVYAKPNN